MAFDIEISLVKLGKYGLLLSCYVLRPWPIRDRQFEIDERTDVGAECVQLWIRPAEPPEK